MSLPIPHRLSLVAALLLVCGLLWCGTAAAQTETTTTESPSPAQTEPAPAPEPEPEPVPPPPPPPTPTDTTPESSPAPGEYVESVPTGSGASPTSPQGGGSPSSATTPTESDPTKEAVAPAVKNKAKKHHAEKTHKRQGERIGAETPTPRGPSVPAAPVATDVGNSARFLWLGLALLMITGGIVSTALARRRRASI
jgi:hypothetical protein